jgi:hypothetical protein
MASIISAGTTSGTALNMAGDTSGVLQLATNGSTTALTIDTSQRVGIGTTSPTSQLSVQTTAGSSTGFLKFTDVTYGGDVRFGKNTGISNDAILGTWVANNVLFYASGAEAMRIDSGGILLVGKTDTTLSTGGLIIEKYTAAGETAGKISVTNRIGTGQYILQGINASGGIVGGVLTTSTATSFNTSSDYRLKENIVPMTGALDKVAQLKPVTYTWKANGSNAQGFIAHELQEVVPDCVTGEKDAVETYTDEDGNEQTRPAYQGIDTSFLVATLTAAIQEQQTIINDLKARVTALEGAA